MEARLQKWGNSDGIRIPSNILKSLNLKTNDILNIEIVEDKIVISIPKKRKISLNERFKMFEKLPDDEKGSVEPYDWGDVRGKEIW